MPERFVLHGFPRNECQILSRGVMIARRQSMGIGKHCIPAAELLRALRHHAAKGGHIAADMLGNGNRCVVAAGEQQPAEQIMQADGFAKVQVDARSRHAIGIAANGYHVLKLAIFQRHERGHHLGCGSHGQWNVCIVFQQHLSGFALDDHRRPRCAVYLVFRPCLRGEKRQQRAADRQQRFQSLHDSVPSCV